MDGAPTQSANETSQGPVERWWPVVVGVILAAGFPAGGVLFSLVMAWMRRWDRTVLIALITIAVVSVIYLVVRVSANSGVVG